MPKKIQRQAKETILFVGEGAIDAAFLRYLKRHYIHRNCGINVNIRNAHGGSPDAIVDYAIRLKSNAAYDKTVVIMDTDVAWKQSTKIKARRKKIQLIGCEPCIEGLMLTILDKQIPDSSDDCKRKMEAIAKGSLTDSSSYESVFTKELIDKKCELIQILREIVGCLKL